MCRVRETLGLLAAEDEDWICWCFLCWCKQANNPLPRPPPPPSGWYFILLLLLSGSFSMDLAWLASLFPHPTSHNRHSFDLTGCLFVSLEVTSLLNPCFSCGFARASTFGIALRFREHVHVHHRHRKCIFSGMVPSDFLEGENKGQNFRPETSHPH